MHLTSAPDPRSLRVAIAFDEDDPWAGGAAAVVTIFIMTPNARFTNTARYQEWPLLEAPSFHSS